MNQNVTNSLNELEKLAGKIKDSQHFDQPVSSDATRKWAEEMKDHLDTIRRELGIDGVGQTKVTGGSLPVDFTVIPRFQ